MTEPLALAIEEFEAQLRFKRLHLVAHGALRDAQLLGTRVKLSWRAAASKALSAFKRLADAAA